MAARAPKRFKTLKLWLVIGLGLIPFTGLPVPVQVGLAVGDVVLLMILSAIARNPGTLAADETARTKDGPDHGLTGAMAFGMMAQEGAAHAAGHAAPHGGHHHDHGGGAADSGQAADGWGGDAGGDSGGGDGGGGGGD